MKLLCPTCDSQISASQLNVDKDVAVCQNCDEVFQLSQLVAAGQDTECVDLFDPPRGAWFHSDVAGWTIGATTRSPVAFFIVPFMCIWSGFSLGGIYGPQIVAGEFNPGLSLFGIPFVIGTLVFGSIAVMTVAGKVVVTVDRNAGRIFTGVGPIGWTRPFDWDTISRIEEDGFYNHYPGSNNLLITLIGKTRVRFGSMLTDARRYYVLQVLRKLLANRSKCDPL